MIIKLNKTHLNDIVELSNEQFFHDKWSKQQYNESLKSESTLFYGIYIGKTLVCFACSLVTPDDINLLKIATRNTHKRMGYARQILKHIIENKQHNQSVSLEVKSSNLAAQKLYESLGFKTLHVRKKYYSNGEDALCMFLF